MNLKRISEFGLSLVLSLSSLLVIAVPKVHAATVTWDGEGADNNFSTAANWSGDAVPVDGDDLVFPSSVDADTVSDNDRVLNNDLTNFIANSIQFTGSYTVEDYDYYEIAGNDISLNGGISNTDAQSFPHVLLNITLTANQTFSGPVMVGSFAGTTSLNMGANSLTFDVADLNCYSFNVYSNISGTGAIIKTGAGVAQLKKANTYSGLTTVSQGKLVASDVMALGTAAAGTVVSSGAVLGFSFAVPATISEPITIGGTGISNSGALTDYGHACTGGGVPEIETITMSGSVTLTADTIVNLGRSNLKITGALSGSFTIGLKDGSSGNLIIDSSSNNSGTQNGTIETPVKETAYSANSPTTDIYVAKNETAIVTGTYRSITVANKGILKGTGTVADVYVEVGGKLAPGLSPGCINSGNLTLNGTYEVEIGGATECTGYDRTNVTGTVDVTGGTLSVIKFNNFVPSAGQVYQIIANDAADAVTGTFTNLAEGATVTVDGVVYRVSYVGGDGNDVTLTVVSVPAAPDTGFQMLTNNPLATLAATMLAAGAILGISKKYTRVTARR